MEHRVGADVRRWRCPRYHHGRIFLSNFLWVDAFEKYLKIMKVHSISVIFCMPTNNSLFQATAPLSSVFIVLQHNVTDTKEAPLYIPGIRDWPNLFFYTLICIVVHAIIQEYILDKVSKKLHLSKSKLAIFSTSGQLAAFYLISIVWGLDIVYREGYLFDVSLLWSNYPAPMGFLLKLFMIVQMSYSLHELPEIYFQRTKKEEYSSKALRSVAGFVLVAIPYFLK